MSLLARVGQKLKKKRLTLTPAPALSLSSHLVGMCQILARRRDISEKRKDMGQFFKFFGPHFLGTLH